MRIALVVTGGLDRSGREHVIPALVSLLERLARRHEVVAFVLRYHQEPCRYELCGAVVRDLGRPEGILRQVRALSRAVREEGRFDIIHGYWAVPAGLAAATVGKRLSIPSVVTFDSGEFVAFPDLGYGLQRTVSMRLAVRATAALAAATTVCSQYQATLAQRHGTESRIIPFGVDPQRFNRFGTASGRTGEAAQRSPHTEGSGRLLHVASLNPVKDQATLIRAFAQVLERGLDVTLDIVGEDTTAGRIAEMARQAGAADHVTFHGYMPGDQLADLYRRSHLFVLSSRHEAAGVVLLEAAACGLPIVGTSVGYIADWAPERATAVPPADPDALARAIADLLRDRDRRERQAASAAQWASLHDVDWTARRLDELYAALA
jgi:glycosyltransferase involved in cell wall biosynthesis